VLALEHSDDADDNEYATEDSGDMDDPASAPGIDVELLQGVATTTVRVNDISRRRGFRIKAVFTPRGGGRRLEAYSEEVCVRTKPKDEVLVRFTASHTAAQLKRLVAAKMKFLGCGDEYAASKQRLIFAGREIKGGSALRLWSGKGYPKINDQSYLFIALKESAVNEADGNTSGVLLQIRAPRAGYDDGRGIGGGHGAKEKSSSKKGGSKDESKQPKDAAAAKTAKTATKAKAARKAKSDKKTKGRKKAKSVTGMHTGLATAGVVQQFDANITHSRADGDSGWVASDSGWMDQSEFLLMTSPQEEPNFHLYLDETRMTMEDPFEPLVDKGGERWMTTYFGKNEHQTELGSSDKNEHENEFGLSAMVRGSTDKLSTVCVCVCVCMHTVRTACTNCAYTLACVQLRARIHATRTHISK
jgi:hypothetical protein